VTLGKPLAILVNCQLTVEPFGRGVLKGAVEEDLASCGFQKVGAANDLCYLHREVVGDTGQLIAWQAIPTPHEKIAEVDAGREALGAEVGITKLDDFAFRNTESPVEAAGCVRE
jgi:hypothetical protein